jgi:exopolysaccharide production protein ExoZ
MKEVVSIQYLRAIAAVAVVCFHASESFDLGFEVGAAGVDIFFVISGYIMWVTTAGRTNSPLKFMRRRISRIVPLYWIVTVMTFAAAGAKPLFFYNHDASLNNLFGSLSFLPSAKNGALHPVVIQGWTLCYEMMFYAIFALTLIFTEARRFWTLLLILGGMVIAHFALLTGYLRIFTAPIILEFAGGVAIARVWIQGWRMPIAFALGTLIAGVMSLITADFVFPNLDRVFRWGVPAAMIVIGAIFAERERPLPKIKPLHFFGDASFSIYIWHVLIGVGVVAVMLRMNLPLPVQPVVLVISSLGLSLVCYLLVERPLVQRLHPSRRSVPPIPARTVRVRCRKCNEVASFLGSDVAHMYGRNHEFDSLPFRCNTCDTKDCEVELSMGS